MRIVSGADCPVPVFRPLTQGWSAPPPGFPLVGALVPGAVGSGQVWLRQWPGGLVHSLIEGKE